MQRLARPAPPLWWLVLATLALPVFEPPVSARDDERVRGRVSTDKKTLRRRLQTDSDRIYLTPNIDEITADRSGKKPIHPKAPLYFRFPPDQVVVGDVAGEHILTRAELEHMVQARIGTQEGVIEDEVIGREWDKLCRRTEDELLHEWALLKTLAEAAERNDIAVSDDEIDEGLAELGGGQSAAASQRTGASRRGVVIDAEAIRTQVADSILIEKLLRLIITDMPEEQLRAVYEATPANFTTPRRVHAWQIVRNVDPDAAREEKKDLRKEFYKIRKKAARKDGRDFQELARQHSDDNATRSSGGDMGWISVNSSYSPTVLQELLNLKPGEVGGIVTTNRGFLILRVTEIREALGLTYDDSAREKVIEFLMFRLKKDLGRPIMRMVDFRVATNPNGLRLLDDAEQGR